MKALLIGILSLTAVGLTACVSSAPVTTTDGTILTPNRTLPERLTDVGIERGILSSVHNISGLTQGNHRIAVDSHQGVVLLTGEVPSESAKLAVQNIAASIREVNRVFNFLKVTDTPKSQSHTVHENYLKGKIRTKLLAQSAILPTQYSIEVRNDVAYVMGMMTQEQQQIIEQNIASIDGLAGLKFLVDVLTPADTVNANNLPSNTNSNTYNSTTNTTASVLPTLTHNTNLSNNATFDNGVNTSYTSPQNTQQGNLPFTNLPQTIIPTPNPNQMTNNTNNLNFNNNQNNLNIPITPIVPNAQSGYVQLYQNTTKP